MKKIDITQQNYRVLTAEENKIPFGRIIYTKWYSGNRAEISIDQNAVYRLEPKGFWQTQVDVFKDEVLVTTINSKFTGYIITRPIDPERSYRFKYKGFFKNGYVLVNYKDEVLLEIAANFSWKKMYPGYSVICSDGFGNDVFEKLLLMLCVHFSRTMQNAATDSATG